MAALKQREYKIELTKLLFSIFALFGTKNGNVISHLARFVPRHSLNTVRLRHPSSTIQKGTNTLGEKYVKFYAKLTRRWVCAPALRRRHHSLRTEQWLDSHDLAGRSIAAYNNVQHASESCQDYFTSITLTSN